MMRAVLVLSALAAAAAQEVPIPSAPDGFRYNVTSNRTAPVQIEGYFDLMCPDTRAAWPALKSALDSFDPASVAFTMHLFPLPYHHNSYLAAEGATIVGLTASSSPFAWMEAVFAAQEQFGNGATAGMSMTEVIAAFGKLASQSAGVNIPAATFINDMNQVSNDARTRISWKLGCARGVSGTPTFFANGARFSPGSSWSASDWTAFFRQVMGN
ncbi:hypothetical protein FNF29_06443 [Cafeteria roenbergensis]|uniref:Thioredoxin-like fold domain-containing protein n=1 Tax=Cafeteria roenbergensis TaxID=33653 RepID=A0A5A8C7I4_CAFRO|nr:hypothetical protein FNF29_06443 [Cafeteria roenbergensis]|eukprot:KAA0148818.1 hypothetical protein FNF29_06443 [Cafeteria roenbergensis]